jgi:Amt family ammonium transporter
MATKNLLTPTEARGRTLSDRGLGAIAAGLVLALASAGGALGQDGLDSGDTAWMLTSTALVLFMTIPGVALFYAGMVRKKNVIATVTQSLAITCLASVIWMVIAYSLAFSDGGAVQAYVGGAGAVMLNGVTIANMSGTIPEYLFVVFQMTFAIITPALIIGAWAERVKFSGVLIFVTAWLILVYAPVCHWVWGGGWLSEAGVLDFAGGTVVHINAGIAGLVGAIVLGRRRGLGSENMAPHNLTLTLIGAACLWVGWFGFNAGSALAANGLAAAAMINTQVATAMAAIAWMIVEILIKRKPTLLGLASGAIAGLVAITPAAGFVNPTGALVIGAAGGVAAYFFSVIVKGIFKYDDSLDVFGIHGVAGIVGALLTGLLADEAIGGTAGSVSQMMTQGLGIGATVVYCGAVSLVLAVILRIVGLFKVNDEQEAEGLDIVLHGEVVQ